MSSLSIHNSNTPLGVLSNTSRRHLTISPSHFCANHLTFAYLLNNSGILLSLPLKPTSIVSTKGHILSKHFVSMETSSLPTTILPQTSTLFPLILYIPLLMNNRSGYRRNSLYCLASAIGASHLITLIHQPFKCILTLRAIININRHYLPLVVNFGQYASYSFKCSPSFISQYRLSIICPA